MSKLNVVRRCFTCGAILQDINKDEPGYISPEILEAGGRALFCNKCYEDDSYNLVPNEIELLGKENSTINAQNNITIKVKIIKRYF